MFDIYAPVQGIVAALALETKSKVVVAIIINVANNAAVALGRKGGLKGGVARAASLTPERRKKIAEKAAQSRWVKTTEPDSR